MAFLNALDGRPVRAILVAHLFGLSISLAEVRAICSKGGIGLIEDCAHCFFGAADGTSVDARGGFAIDSLPKAFPGHCRWITWLRFVPNHRPASAVKHAETGISRRLGHS